MSHDMSRKTKPAITQIFLLQRKLKMIRPRKLYWKIFMMGFLIFIHHLMKEKKWFC
jgi:hypothetical protein